MIVSHMIISAFIVSCVIAESNVIQKARKVKKEMNVYRIMMMNTKYSDAELQKKAAEIIEML